MSFLAELRAAFGPEWDGRSDEELLSAYADAAGMDRAQVADLAGYSTGGGTKNRERLSGSIDRWRAGLYDFGRGVASALGADGLARRFEQGRARNEFSADVAAQRASALGAVDSYKDVDWLSPSSVGDYALGLGIQSLPYVAEFALPGTAVRMGMRGTQAARAAAMAAGDVAGAARATQTLNRAALGTGLAASYPSSVGDIMSSQRDQAGVTDDGSAFALGVPYAALNLFSPIDTALARGTMFRNPVRALDEVGGARGAAARMAASGLRVGAQEGLNEVGQEGMNQLGRMQVDPNEGFLSDAARERFGEAFVGGAVLGGTLGAGAGGWRRGQIQTEPIDLLNRPQPGSDWTLTQGFEDVRRPTADVPVSPLGDLTPDWTTDLGAMPQRPSIDTVDPTGLFRSVDEPPRTWTTNLRGPQPMGEMPGIDWPYTADRFGAVAPGPGQLGVPTAADALYGEENGDPGLALARKRFEEAQQAQERRRLDAEAVAKKKAEIEAAKTRAVEVLGNMKMGSRHVELFVELEKQRELGVIDQDTFVSDAALLSNNELGRVRKLVQERAPQVAAAQQAREETNVQSDVPGTAAGAAGAVAQRGDLAGGSGGAVRPVAPGAAVVDGRGAAVVDGRGAATPGSSGAQAGSVAVAPPGGQPAALTSIDPVQRRRMTDEQLQPHALAILERAGIDPQRTRTVKRKQDGKMVDTPRTALQLTIDMMRADDYDTALVEGVTGINFADGTINEPLTLDQAVEYAAARSGKKISKQAAQVRLAKYGIGSAEIDRIANAGVGDTVTEAELGLGQQQEGTEVLPGFRVEQSIADAAGSGIVDTAVTNTKLNRRALAAEKQLRETNPELAARMLGTERGRLDKETADKQTVAARMQDPTAGEDPEFVRKRELAAQIARDRARAAITAPQAKTVEEYLRPDVLKGNIAEVDISDARELWNDENDGTMPAFNDLDVDLQAAWVRAYHYAQSTGELQGRVADEQAQRNQRRGGRPGAPGDAARVGGPGSQAAAPAAVQAGDGQAAPQVLQSGAQQARRQFQQYRLTTAQVEADPGVRYVRDAFDKLGVGHAFDFVSDWYAAPEATFWAVGTRQRVAFTPVSEGVTRGVTAYEVAHEVGHAVDQAGYGIGGVYSTHPDLAFDRMDGRIVPVGDVAVELEFVRLQAGTDTTAETLAEILAYPLDPNDPATAKYVKTTDRASQELFAQLWAAYLIPDLRAYLKANAPAATAFIEKVYADVRQTRPRQTHTVDTQAKRAAAFLAANPKPRADLFAQARELSRQADGLRSGTGQAAARLIDGQAKSLADLPAPPGRATGVRGFIDGIFKDGLWRTHPKLLGWLTGEQLGERFKDLPMVRRFAEMSSRMAGRATQIMAASDRLKRRWDALKEADARTLNDLLLDSTVARIWPDKDFRDPANLHVEDTPENRAEHARLRERWNQATPEVRSLYMDVTADFAERYKAKVAALRQGVVSTFYPDESGDGKGLTREEVDALAQAKKKDREELQAKLGTTARRAREIRQLLADLDAHDSTFKATPGPYFPLMRFGKNVVSIKSKAYREAEAAYMAAIKALAAAENDAPADADLKAENDEVKRALTVLNNLKRSDSDYRVEFYETYGEARARADQARAALGEDFEVNYSLKDEYLRSVDATSPTFMRRLEGKLGQYLEGKQAEAVKQAVREMYVQMLPESSMMKSELKRRNVAGASRDALRSFAASAVRDAHGISRLEYQAPLRDALDALRFNRGNPDAQIVGQELARRLQQNFEFVETPLIGAFSNLTYLTYLGLSPSFMITQLTQPWFISAPVLAARHHMKSFGALREAMGAAGKMLYKDAKGQKTAHFSFDPQRALKAGEVTQDEALMLQALLDSGHIDITITQDLGATSQGRDETWLSKLTTMSAVPAQQLEVMNRVATALAAYRLQKQLELSRGVDNPKATENARRYAEDVISQTHLNYAAENRARYMHPSTWGGWGRIMWQFRSYQQGMVYLTLKNLIDWSRGDKEARRASIYLAGTMIGAAGVSGLPGAAAIGFVAKMLYDAFKDEDDEKDARQVLYAGLESVVGKEVANAMVKGLPALANVDLSSRVGMGNIFSPAPYADDRAEGRDLVSAYWVAMTGGAFFGAVGNWAEAIKHANNGDIAKAAQTALPKVVADQIRWARESTEGVTDSRGRQLVAPEERGVGDAVIRALGFSSVEDARMRERRGAFFEAREKRDTVRQSLLTDFAQARLKGEPVTDVLQKINEFNARHPDARITAANRESAVRSTRDRAKEMRGGVPVRKRDQALADELGV